MKTFKNLILLSSLFIQVFFIGCSNSSDNSSNQTLEASDTNSTINSSNEATQSTDAVAAQTPETPTEKLPLPDEELLKGWQRVYVKNTCNLDMPTTLEVQAGKYREFVVENNNSKGYEGSQLTMQQAGLNDKLPEAFEKYARVMIETTFGNTGDYEKLNFNFGQYSEKDISDLNEQMKSQTVQGFYGTELKLTEWLSTKLEKINGMSCIHISYTRQFQDKPIVMVDTYTFPNNDRVHHLTMSYRVSDADYWIKDYKEILKSFRITSVK